MDILDYASEYHKDQVYNPPNPPKIKEEDEWQNSELSSSLSTTTSSSSEFNKVETGILATCGVLVAASVAVSIFVWRYRTTPVIERNDEMSANSNVKKSHDLDLPPLQVHYESNTEAGVNGSVEYIQIQIPTVMHHAHQQQKVRDLSSEVSHISITMPDEDEGEKDIETEGIHNLATSATITTHRPLVAVPPPAITTNKTVINRFLSALRSPQRKEINIEDILSPLDLPDTEFLPFIGDSSMKLVTRADVIRNFRERRKHDELVYNRFYNRH